MQHLPEVRIVIESMQRELQLARQRLPQRRLASAAGPVIKICSALLCITSFAFSTAVSRMPVTILGPGDSFGPCVQQGVVPISLSRQLFEQCPGLLEVGGVEPLGEPAIDGRQ